MKQIIQPILEALERGESVVLCSILSASGSSPRGAGAKMAVFADGHTEGTVGGGPVEYAATQEAKEVLQEGMTRIRAFSLSNAQVASIGMICGGNVTLYYQLLRPEDLPILREMQEALTGECAAWLRMEIDGEELRSFTVIYEKDAACGNRPVLEEGELLRYTEPLNRVGRVYIFGGGHVGKALVPVLDSIDFRVVVFDKRVEVAKKEQFPCAEQVIFGDYEHIFDKVTLKPEDYAIIMTPGHESDFALLEQILTKDLRYVGCIGSRSKIAKTKERLTEAGLAEERINAVHWPIGLAIGAQTPAEIAISIAAELIQVRRNTEA